MSYDAEDMSPPTIDAPTMAGNDLESITTLLELGAICLTTAPGMEFSLEQLLAKTMEIGGREIGMKEADAIIVLDHSKFLRKIGKNKYKLK